MDKKGELAQRLEECGYRVEEDMKDSSAAVVYFPVKVENFDRGQEDVSMWEQLELAAQVQKYWADNSVSVTVTFKPEEAKDIARALELYESRLKSVSFLPLMDHGYEQAPWQPINEAQYVEAVAHLRPLTKVDDVVSKEGGVFCDGDSCEV
jgi:hypothetical protein